MKEVARERLCPVKYIADVLRKLVSGETDCMALLVSVSTFMWVKNLTVPHSKLIKS